MVGDSDRGGVAALRRGTAARARCVVTVQKLNLLVLFEPNALPANSKGSTAVLHKTSYTEKQTFRILGITQTQAKNVEENTRKIENFCMAFWSLFQNEFPAVLEYVSKLPRQYVRFGFWAGLPENLGFGFPVSNCLGRK